MDTLLRKVGSETMTDETLEEFLTRNKDKIEYVVLIWWYSEKRSVQSNKVYVEKDGQPVPLEMAFDVKVRDWEYCFIGEIDDAIEYAQSYGQWDERAEDANISDGVLYLEYENYNPDYNYHPKDLDPNDNDILDITPLGYITYGHSNGHEPVYYQKYFGPIMDYDEWKKKYGQDDDE